MKIDISTLPLDHPAVGWAVAESLGIKVHVAGHKDSLCRIWHDYKEIVGAKPFYHQSPDVMVQLMEKFRIGVMPVIDRDTWKAYEYTMSSASIRDTMIEAVLACFCKMKGEVEVPDELC